MPKDSAIFISHAAADKELIDKFFDLLQLGCEFRTEDIFCTSIDGAGIQIGADFVAWIDKSLTKSKTVILMISENYLNSRFCIAEMGAAWALDKNVFPIIIPPVPRAVGGVLHSTQSARLNEQGLDDLRDILIKHHQDTVITTARWTAKKDEFLEKLPALLEQLPQAKMITAELFEKEKVKTQGYRELLESEQEKTADLQKLVDKLKPLKDVEAVKEIIRESQPENERYEKFTSDLIEQLSGLSNVEVRCLYAHISGEEWTPSDELSPEDMREVNRAVQKEWVNEVDGMAYHYIEINEVHPRSSKFIEIFHEFSEFFESEMSSTFFDSLQEEVGYIVNPTNMEYWEEVLVGERMWD
jgi:hypothetical protein